MTKHSRMTSLAIVALACTAALAPAPAPDAGSTSSSRVDDEVKVCEQAITELTTAARNTLLIKPDDPRFAIWAHRWVSAIRASDRKKADKIAALDKAVQTAKRHEAWADQWVKTGQAPNSAVLDARFQRLEAELALAHEKGQ